MDWTSIARQRLAGRALNTFTHAAAEEQIEDVARVRHRLNKLTGGRAYVEVADVREWESAQVLNDKEKQDREIDKALHAPARHPFAKKGASDG